MHPSRRTLLAAAAGLPLLHARPGAAQGSTSARPGVLRFGLSTFPPNLQPWVSTGASAGTVKLQLHRSLVGYDSKGELQGELAESWARDESGAWVFKLRPNAFFHNGDPVTVDDVRWSIEQVAGEKSTAYMRAQFQLVSSIETPDARTIRLVTSSPQPTLPTWFANYNMFVLSRKSEPNAPIGAGPFRLANTERGTAIDVVAFDKYYKPGFPKLRAIRFVAYPDENLRVTALRSGDVDIIEYVPWQSMAGIATDPRLHLAETQGAAVMEVLFNGSRKPFDDPRVRRAVAHAVKREDIVQAVFFGRGGALEGVPIPEGSPYYDPALARGWAYDPARAKSLLAEAGYPNGFSTTLLSTATYSMHKDTAEVVQQHLRAVGIEAELKLPDWPTRVALGGRGQYDMAIFGTAADSNDPEGLASMMDPSLSPAYSRSFGMRAPRTAEAFARGRSEFDPARRVAAYRDMQAAAIEEVPIVGLAWRSQGYAMDRRVQGFTNLPAALSTSSGFILEETSFL